MSAPVPQITWCDEDDHRRYEDYTDFNEWLDGVDGAEVQIVSQVAGLSQPSKAFFAGDREAYELAFREYRLEQRHSQLNETFIHELTSGDHWFEHNEQHFDQLCGRLQAGEVIPFVGAGISQPGGFPTWKAHLRQQGETAGITPEVIEERLNQGQYEEIIEEIENLVGPDVFIHEIRDAFAREGNITDSIYLLAEMFRDTIITTNYDRLIEQAFDTGGEVQTQVLTPAHAADLPDATKTTIVKLHGDAGIPAGCILSKRQYDEAYGPGALDLSLPIPQALDFYYRNSSLLFLGCALNQDRTIQVRHSDFEKLAQDEPSCPCRK